MGWIKPKAVAIKTEGWADDILDAAGTIWEIAVYDDAVAHHLCEFTPSLELHVVDYVSEYQLDDELDGEVRSHLGDENGAPYYYHVHDVEKMPNIALPPAVRYRKENYDETLEEVVQAYREQPPYIKELDQFIYIDPDHEDPNDAPAHRSPDDLGWSSEDKEVRDEWFEGDDHLRFQRRANLAAVGNRPGIPEKFLFKGGLFTAIFENHEIVVECLRQPRGAKDPHKNQLQLVEA